MTRRNTERGLTSVGFVIYLTFIAAFYAAYIYLPILIQYYEIHEVMSRTANNAYTISSDEELETKCHQWLKMKGFKPLPGDRCVISRDDEKKTATSKVMYRPVITLWPTKEMRQYAFEVSSTQSMAYYKY